MVLYNHTARQGAVAGCVGSAEQCYDPRAQRSGEVQRSRIAAYDQERLRQQRNELWQCWAKNHWFRRRRIGNNGLAKFLFGRGKINY
jgi:hypothetical protein